MNRLVAAVILCALMGGCGYKLGEIRPTPMRSVRTLAVPTFKNRTYEPRVEVLLADTLIKTLQEDGTYTIVSDDTADAIMNCTGQQSGTAFSPLRAEQRAGHRRVWPLSGHRLRGY